MTGKYSDAQGERRIVITFDTDFADMSEFPLGTHAGVIRLRIFPQTLEILHPILERELAELEQANIAGCLVIIDNWRVRVKRLISEQVHCHQLLCPEKTPPPT